MNVRRVATMLAWLLPAAAVVLLWALQPRGDEAGFGSEAGRRFWGSLVEMASFLPAMFVLVGLFDAWVPRRVVERHVGPGSGPAAALWMILLATTQAGPLYAAFPMAEALWRKGAAARNVFIYLGAFSAMKIPMLTFEVGFLGWRFSLARTALTLPVFVALAFVLERLLPKGFCLPERPREAATLEGTGPLPSDAR